MRPLRFVLVALVPVSVAGIAWLNATAVTSLVEGTLSAPTAMSALPPRPAKVAESVRSADAILDRNPFDHETSLRPPPNDPPSVLVTDPATAPICEGVRPVVLVGDEDQDVAFAALDVGGKRMLRRRGGDVGDRKVAYVGRTRVWLEGRAGLCQAPLFGNGTAAASPAPVTPLHRSPLEEEIAMHIRRRGDHEYAIDRSTLDRILEAQAELGRIPARPERDARGVLGVKLLTIRPGSVLSMIGLESGDRLETVNGYEVGDPQRALEAYARLRQADMLTLEIARGSKKVTLDYSIQ